MTHTHANSARRPWVRAAVAVGLAAAVATLGGTGARESDARPTGSVAPASAHGLRLVLRVPGEVPRAVGPRER
ncbi:hypothetical protein ABZ746_15995 [Streptomyces sp. NPDC020096]